MQPATALGAGTCPLGVQPCTGPPGPDRCAPEATPRLTSRRRTQTQPQSTEIAPLLGEPQEGRHALARKICHGKKGELYHRYERGLENQLGSLGLVLNCVVLWTTVYLDAAVRQLRAQGYQMREEDMVRLSPFVSTHLGVHGAYSFVLPDLAPGAIRELRDPDAGDEDDE